MTDDRLEWFPCYPEKLLGALAGMKASKKLTYMIVLLRIYESGGSCRDTIEAITRRVGVGRKLVVQALSELESEGRITRNGGSLENPVAAEFIHDGIRRKRERENAGRKAAKQRWEKEKKNQQKGDGKPNATAVGFDASESIPIQDSLFPEGKRARAEESVAMKDPPLDAEADYYRRGREVLGKAAGGFLTKLLRAKGGNVSLARAAIEQASTRGDAREYVGAMIRNGGDNGKIGGRGERLGFAGIAAKIRYGDFAARAAACGDEPENGRGDSEGRDERMARNRQAALPAPRSHG